MGNASDSAYNVGLDPTFNNIPHSSSKLTVEWFASGAGWEGGDNESWGIDNVQVILNNDVILPKLSISDTQIVEGDRGTKNAVFNLKLSKPSDEKVTVKYTTVNGSAKSLADYIGKQGTVTFNPNPTKQTIAIPLIGDTLLYGNEL